MTIMMIVMMMMVVVAVVMMMMMNSKMIALMRPLENGVFLSQIMYELSKEVHPVNLRMSLHVHVICQS